jgi:hypothetical protein
VCPGNS